MKENLTEHRTALWPRLIALTMIIAIASVVGYVAWQTSLIPQYEPITSEALPAEFEPLPSATGVFYVAAAPIGSDRLSTYSYNIATNQWNQVLDYSDHQSYVPVGASAAYLTMSVAEADESAENQDDLSQPAVLQVDTGEFNYLSTAPGYRETHYRPAPGGIGVVAYMQQPERSASETDSQIDDWEVVIHQPSPLSNTIIADAMYPQWLSESEILVLQQNGLVIYNIVDGTNEILDIPVTDFSPANTFALSALDLSGHRQLLLVASSSNSMSVLAQYSHSENADHSFIEVTEVADFNAVFSDVILVADGTQFALLKSSYDPLTEESDSKIILYHANSYQEITSISTNRFDPQTITLLGWTQ